MGLKVVICHPRPDKRNVRYCPNCEEYRHMRERGRGRFLAICFGCFYTWRLKDLCGKMTYIVEGRDE